MGLPFLWGYHLWTTTGVETLSHPIAMKIPRWRFREISRYLDLAPRGSPTFDRLGKVRPVIAVSGSQPCTLYNPSSCGRGNDQISGSQTVYAYEADQAWAGVLGDSTNGYFIRFEVYTEIQTLVSGNTW